MNLAENLKYLRKLKNIGQAELAQALNVSVKTVSHWETAYTEPSIAQLIQLADFFDVSIDELVGRIS
nr:helix-turn-helix transcriptional regulator [Clostridia bacterium]